jgi:flagellar biosynthesis protein
MNDLPGPREAAALAYEPGRGAPRVVAKGRGEIAQRIVAAATMAGVPVHRSPELVGLLMQVDLDRHVPEALYLAVAEVLVWAHGLGPPPGGGARNAA